MIGIAFRVNLRLISIGIFRNSSVNKIRISIQFEKQPNLVEEEKPIQRGTKAEKSYLMEKSLERSFFEVYVSFCMAIPRDL